MKCPLRGEEPLDGGIVDVSRDDGLVAQLAQEGDHPDMAGVGSPGAYVDDVARVLEDVLAVVAGDSPERDGGLVGDIGVLALVEVRLLVRHGRAEEDLLVDADAGLRVAPQVPAQAEVALSRCVLLEDDLLAAR
ncbi:hypothetical protein HDZ31DRAFT_37295 [Schizophyllum fasciatum]